jgi:parvulin-like peptidyl-prolyl isomerase
MSVITSRTIVARASRWKKPLGFLLGAVIVVAICVAIRDFSGGPQRAAATPPDSPTRQSSARQATDYPVRQASAKESTRSAAAAPNLRQAAPQRPQQADSGETADTSSALQKSVAGKTIKRPVAQVVADVNGQRITRDELAQNVLQHYGEEVMETLRNRYLIAFACEKQHIKITRADVDAEIERMAARFNLPVDQWLKMLKQERGLTGDQYAEEIIWPTLALRKLAGARAKVTREEIVDEFEIMYGKQVVARLIAVNDPEEAEVVRKDAAAHASDVEYFGKLAKQHSVDAPSAASGGVIQPILKHGTYPEIEDVAFGMKDGEVSPVIKIVKSEQYVILRKDHEVPARTTKLDDLLAGKLEEIIRDRKLRTEATDIFKDLHQQAKVVDVWNDPEAHKKYPDVAATIDGRPISMPEFVKACLDRHGEEVLQGMIGRKLIEIEARKKNIGVTDADLSQEVARSAAAELKPRKDGSPDVENFQKMIVQEQHIKFDGYLHDAVWPAVALRKLAEPSVKVTDDDLKKGFEANYGPRVRCLAIVMNNERRATEVWEKAREKNTSEKFGDLAAEYSIEPGSQALRGEVPPIKRNGGQPKLESEAFKLKPGELSGIIQVQDKFVILRCEGYTEPVLKDFAQVKPLIYDDLYEKKLRVEMMQCYDRIQDAATIDNYLTGSSRAPNRKDLVGPEEANSRSARQVPAAYQQPRTK